MRAPIFVVLAALSLPALAKAQAPAVPTKGPSTRELERVNWMELREHVPKHSQTVLLPLGTLEAHGVTANGADILAPVAIARDIAPGLEAFVAPVIPYGFTGSMDAYPGAFTVPEDAYRAYVRAVLVGLARNRFRNIVMVNGHGGGQTAATELGIPFLGEVPLDLAIRTQSDIGVPIVIAQPEAPSAQVLRQIAEKVAAQVSIRSYEAPLLEVE